MTIDFKKLLKKHKLSEDALKSISEAVEVEINQVTGNKIELLEKENSTKFNSLVEGIRKKFDDKVGNVILENVKNNVGKTINSKFYNIVKDMVNLLEHAGIPATEKTKELQQKLKSHTEKMADQWKERNEIKGQLMCAEKENMIYAQLRGMKPEIIDAAIEHFKNKEMEDVQEELEDFLNGDFSELTYGENTGDEQADIDLKGVQSALQSLNAEKSETAKNQKFAEKVKYESLGKGLRQKRVSKTPNVTVESLDEASNQAILENKANLEEDTQQAMDKIDDFSNLGYHFRKDKKS